MRYQELLLANVGEIKAPTKMEGCSDLARVHHEVVKIKYELFTVILPERK